MSDLAQREVVIAIGLRMNEVGLNQGTSGNLSLRLAEDRGFLVTPSGVPYDRLQPQHLVEVRFDGTVPPGQLVPSSEWAIHRDIYVARPEVGAVLHAHPPFSTALACTRQGIPAFHYMVASAGGRQIRCADYATFGTPELSAHVLRALEGVRACLMANHGMVAVAESITGALKLAVEVEALAAQYMRALQVGEPVLLPDDEMDRVLTKFASYGKQTAL